MSKLGLTFFQKLLLVLTTLFALYNLYEIGMVVFSNNGDSVNGFLDLLLPFLVIANLVWLYKQRNWAVYSSLLLCVLSVVGAIIMIEHGLTGFSGF